MLRRCMWSQVSTGYLFTTRPCSLASVPLRGQLRSIISSSSDIDVLESSIQSCAERAIDAVRFVCVKVVGDILP
jgi:hypothetical protein